MSVISILNTYIFAPAIPISLFATGIYFLFKLKFYPFRTPRTSIKAMIKPYGSKSGISPFSAVTVALAGTLGVGNIAGVATAITAGGPGAVFWMLVSAIIASILKYAEVLLGMVYRRQTKDGIKGGAVFYIRDGIKNPHLASVFALLCILSSLSMGNIIQTQAVSESFNDTFGLPPAVSGVIIAVITLVVVCGGVKWISSVTLRLIPFLSIAYIVFSMYIIIMARDELPRVFMDIIDGAFRTASAAGGVGGFLLMRSLRFGVARGIASNEAGCGTAPTAHAQASSTSPAAQGLWGIFEVFADTILLCTMTALVILISYNENSSLDGMVLAISAYENYFGASAGFIMSGAIFFFAVATVICWAYYGCESVDFLTGNSKKARYLYMLSYCAIAAIAPFITSSLAWELSDLSLGLMTVINSICLILLRKCIVDETVKCFVRKKRREKQCLNK